MVFEGFRQNFVKISCTNKSFMRLTVECLCDQTSWGDCVAIVGSEPTMGQWAPERGLRLCTDASRYPRWHLADVDLKHVTEIIEFKFIIVRADGAIYWEPLLVNRRLAVGPDGSSHACVVAKFGVPAEELQKLVLPTLLPVLPALAQLSPCSVLVAAPSQHEALAAMPPPIMRPVAVPLRAMPAPLALGSPLANRISLHTRAAYPLDPIASLDQSWPPSVDTSVDGDADDSSSQMLNSVPEEVDAAAPDAPVTALEGHILLQSLSLGNEGGARPALGQQTALSSGRLVSAV